MSIKRKYIKPIIEVYKIDQEISLVMASGPPTDPPEELSPAAAPESSSDFQPTLKSESPFGGDAPNYDNM